MACSIPYLDDKYQGEQLKELRKKHTDLVKKTISSKLFYRRDGFLQLSMDKTSNIRKQQEDFVNSNPELSIIQNNDKDVLSLKVDKDVIPDVPVVNNLPFESDEDFDSRIFYDIDSDTLRETHEFSNYIDENGENEQKFLGIISSLKKRFEDYINLLEEGLIEYPSSDKEIKLKELRTLKNLLNDSTTQDAVIGLNNYVSQSVQWIDIIYKEFFEEQSNVMNRVKALNNLDEETRESEIYELSRILNKSTQFLYLFQGLQDFKDELQRDGFIPEDKFNLKFYNDKDLFIKSLQSIQLDEVNNLSDKDIADLWLIFNNEKLSVNDLRELILNKVVDNNEDISFQKSIEVKQQIDKLLEDNTKNTFTSQMNYSLSKASKLQSDIKNLHYKLTTEFLFPEFEELQLKNYDKTSDRYIDKRKFEALLKIADKDENILTSWLEATIQSKDPLVSMVAKKISNSLFEVHQQNIKDGNNIAFIRDKYLKDKTTEEKKQIYNSFINEVTVLETDVYGDIIELSPEDDRLSIDVEVLGVTKRYLARKAKAFKTGKHTSLLEGKRKIVNDLIYRNKKDSKSLINQILDKALDSTGELDYKKFFNYVITNQDKKEIQDIGLKVFKTNVNGQYLPNAQVKSNYTTKELKSIIENSLWSSMYYKDAIKSFNVQQVTDTVSKQSDKDKFIEDNTYEGNITDGLKYMIYNNKSVDNIFSYIKDGVQVFRYKDDTSLVKYATLDELKDLLKEDKVQSIYYKTKDLQGVSDDYLLQEYTGEYKDLFDSLVSKYNEGNNKLGRQKLKHSIIPQIEKSGITSLEDLSKESKSLFQSIMDFFVDAYKSIVSAWNKLNDSEELNEDEKTAFEQEYLNGEKVKQVSIRYNTLLDNQDEVEWDLSVSVGAYSFMVNQYDNLKKYDPQMRVIKTIVTGDTMLGIEARQTKKTDLFNRVIKRRKRGRTDEDNFKREVAKNLNSKLVEFIDDMMYGENDYLNFGLGKLNSKSLEKTLSSYSAYTSLVWNIQGMLSNISNGKVATYLEAIQGKYFTTKEYGFAEQEYYKNVHNHYKDFMATSLKDKSKVGQLLVILDAIQGEYLDDFKSVNQKKSWNDLTKSALSFTQNGAEHYIQTVNMIAMLKADGLWDSIEYKEGEELKFSEDEWKRLREFQGKLHSVNKRLNGAYSKIDKARLQRRWFGRLILMFRKYIWQMYKARFQSERLDVESGDIVRGYVSQYYKDLVKDLKSNQSVAWKALRILKQIGTDNKRFVLNTVNALSLGQLDKNEKYVKLYGFQNLSKDEIQEARRYLAEVSLFTAFTLLGALLGSLEDDDEEKSVLLSNLELLAKRQRSDMGAFLPSMLNIPTGFDAGAFNTFDFIRKTVSSPIPAMRSVDNSISVLSQMTGIEYKDNQLNFTINDEYEKSGNGYEKGDLKITRKLQKSIIAPYWQLLKLMNPSEQLQFLNMINKNSK